VNFKPFGGGISQKFDRLRIYDINLLKFEFYEYSQKIRKKYDKKLDQILSYVIKTLFQNLIV
jgi:hypothetical protein